MRPLKKKLKKKVVLVLGNLHVLAQLGLIGNIFEAFFGDWENKKATQNYGKLIPAELNFILSQQLSCANFG